MATLARSNEAIIMKLLKAYQYFFYKLYRFYETSTYSRWWSEWKALTTILAIELWTIASVFYYVQAQTSKSIMPSSIYNPSTISILILLGGGNWYLFEHKDKWKNIVEEFDKLTKKQNRIGSVIVLLVILASIVNVVFSVYTLSQSVAVD